MFLYQLQCVNHFLLRTWNVRISRPLNSTSDLSSDLFDYSQKISSKVMVSTEIREDFERIRFRKSQNLSMSSDTCVAHTTKSDESWVDFLIDGQLINVIIYKARKYD